MQMSLRLSLWPMKKIGVIALDHAAMVGFLDGLTAQTELMEPGAK
jgi:hypothetical protein